MEDKSIQTTKPRSDSLGSIGSLGSIKSDSEGSQKQLKWSKTAFELIKETTSPAYLSSSITSQLTRLPSSRDEFAHAPVDPKAIASILDQDNPNRAHYEAINTLYLFTRTSSKLEDLVLLEALLSTLADGDIFSPEDLFYLIHHAASTDERVVKGFGDALGQLLNKGYFSKATVEVLIECFKNTPEMLKKAALDFKKDTGIPKLILHFFGDMVLDPNSVIQLDKFLKKRYDNLTGAYIKFFKKWMERKGKKISELKLNDLENLFSDVKNPDILQRIKSTPEKELADICLVQAITYYKASILLAAGLNVVGIKKLAPDFVESVRNVMPDFIKSIRNTEEMVAFGCNLHCLEKFPTDEELKKKYNGCLIYIKNEDNPSLCFIKDGQMQSIAYNRRNKEKIKKFISDVSSDSKYLSNKEIRQLDVICDGKLRFLDKAVFIAEVRGVKGEDRKRTLMTVSSVYDVEQSKTVTGLVQIEREILEELKNKYKHIEVEDIIKDENKDAIPDYYVVLKTGADGKKIFAKLIRDYQLAIGFRLDELRDKEKIEKIEKIYQNSTENYNKKSQLLKNVDQLEKEKKEVKNQDNKIKLAMNISRLEQADKVKLMHLINSKGAEMGIDKLGHINDIETKISEIEADLKKKKNEFENFKGKISKILLELKRIDILLEDSGKQLVEIKQKNIANKYIYPSIKAGGKILPNVIFQEEINFTTQLNHIIKLIPHYLQTSFLLRVKEQFPDFPPHLVDKFKERLGDLIAVALAHPYAAMTSLLPRKFYNEIPLSKEEKMQSLGLGKEQTDTKYILYRILDKFISETKRQTHMHNFYNALTKISSYQLPNNENKLELELPEDNEESQSTEDDHLEEDEELKDMTGVEEELKQHEDILEAGEEVSEVAVDIKNQWLNGDGIAEAYFELFLAIKADYIHKPGIQESLEKFRNTYYLNFLGIRNMISLEDKHYIIAEMKTSSSQKELSVAVLVAQNSGLNWETISDSGLVKKVISHADEQLRQNTRFFLIVLAAIIKKKSSVNNVIVEMKRLGLDIKQLLLTPLDFVPKFDGKEVNLVQYAALAENYQFFVSAKEFISNEDIGKEAQSIRHKMRKNSFDNFVSDNFPPEKAKTIWSDLNNQWTLFHQNSISEKKEKAPGKGCVII